MINVAVELSLEAAIRMVMESCSRGEILFMCYDPVSQTWDVVREPRPSVDGYTLIEHPPFEER